MYDNLLHQKAAEQLKSDIRTGQFPGSVLFSGPHGSGKLTAALETARILSCTGTPSAAWNCSCLSCMQHKALVSGNLILAGPRACTPEISAASYTFLQAVSAGAPYLAAARYLFLRSIRKLTVRFSPVLWQDDDKIHKIAAVVSEIDEELEPLDFPHLLPEEKNIEKSSKKLLELCRKLENDFLYASIPINQIRNVSLWARMKSAGGRKTVIIENADRMLESVRNALLKILEEPPEDTVFILTTEKRSAVMPTILSRTRTYTFCERTPGEEHEIISRVFHRESFSGSISEYLQTFLPVQPDVLQKSAQQFFSEIAASHIPDIQGVIKECGGFEPREMLTIFLVGLMEKSRGLLKSPAGAQAVSGIVQAVQNCWNNVTVFNQSVQAALEVLVKELSKINKIHGNVLSCAIM